MLVIGSSKSTINSLSKLSTEESWRNCEQNYELYETLYLILLAYLEIEIKDNN